ncbi:TfoX/Sxy family protein [Dyadobacter sp. CY261]|uniref:TfoX/Sxy family protein n=1 Tax=Dyadobacter sp. CY261 TaxID=2907203 RepID=UPI001F48518A|nr:TfoX/Sxy family protein [Dyadobacter sp. CY261]MCF0075171.1 TfoX/Sxy family protein [Dyadobacter sp. CY261]
MAYDERVANRVREALANQALVEERILFQGLAFMIGDKLCICVRSQVLMCRIGHEQYEAALEINGVEAMIHNGRSMKGYVFVSPQAYATREAFDGWIQKCLHFNKFAKSSKKKKK